MVDIIAWIHKVMKKENESSKYNVNFNYYKFSSNESTKTTTKTTTPKQQPQKSVYSDSILKLNIFIQDSNNTTNNSSGSSSSSSSSSFLPLHYYNQ